MRHPALKTNLAAVLFAVICAACSATPETSPVTHPSLASAAASNPPNFAADLNRNIATAAMLQSSAVSTDYQIGSEDLLEITLFNIPEAHGMERQVTPRITLARVSQQGQISLPVVGEIEIKGLTISAAEQRLRERYDKYLYNPQVGVLVKEFRQRVSIMGAVQKAGMFELSGPKTVIEILAMSGGVTEKAGSQIHIYRVGPKERENHIIDLSVLANSIGLVSAMNANTINMPVQPGDVINVPEAGMFFVDGAVKKPGSYLLGRRYSLTQALATAGGIDRELNSDEISIFRRNGPGKVETLVFDLDAVLAGKAADPELQPDDVILLPISSGKYFVKRFVGNLIGGLSLGSFVPRPY
jgi:polysaccharide export outer membrane protein